MRRCRSLESGVGPSSTPDSWTCSAPRPRSLLADLAEVEDWPDVLERVPRLDRDLTEDELDNALEAIADFVDLKSPHSLGHSRSVADLAGAAASHVGVDPVLMRQAGLVHDLGRYCVPSAVWDKPGPLTAAERERVRLHPYYTDRMLSHIPALAGPAAVAAQHHERLDGSGYPRGITAETITAEGRLLAAADCLRAWSEPRPHRPAGTLEQVTTRLRDQVRAGRLDGAAVDAVLRASGQRVRRQREWPAGLTAREVEVLRLLARGLTTREIAEELVISRKTASNHAEHVYAKIGVRNRAMASLYASRHGLLAP